MLENILPALYPYKIVQSSVSSVENFQCEIRAKIDCEEDFLQWLKEFESTTNSSWILRTSVSSSEKSRHRFSRNYLCQHSDYRKKKETSKNKNCSASLTVRVKKNTRSVRGMSPAAAKKYHEATLLSKSPESLANSRINPPVRWIYRIYQKWKEENVDEFYSEPNFNKLQKPSIIKESDQMSLSSQSVASKFKEMMNKISTLLESCNDQDILKSAEEFVHKCKHIESTKDLQSFFDECLTKNLTEQTNR